MNKFNIQLQNNVFLNSYWVCKQIVNGFLLLLRKHDKFDLSLNIARLHVSKYERGNIEFVIIHLNFFSDFVMY